MKKCFKCSEVKPLSEFYKHKQMADGHLNKCKECTKKDVKKNRDDNVDYYRDYDAWRFRNDPRVKYRHKMYYGTDSCVESMSKSRSRWIDNNPYKRSAQLMLNMAVRDGKINKPENCSCCGLWYPSRKIHGHHHDYADPFNVTWLCYKCHAAMHYQS